MKQDGRANPGGETEATLIGVLRGYEAPKDERKNKSVINVNLAHPAIGNRMEQSATTEDRTLILKKLEEDDNEIDKKCDEVDRLNWQKCNRVARELGAEAGVICRKSSSEILAACRRGVPEINWPRCRISFKDQSSAGE